MSLQEINEENIKEMYEIKNSQKLTVRMKEKLLDRTFQVYCQKIKQFIKKGGERKK
ncbi:MAG: hypothetical protein OEL89_01300 [Candidatus Peregrinibacteria bacterium]|nr:hypothetical protein [Candidatus Peregrinibacteria bacterium]